MSATFACPHCGASYPVKPVLVGRAVRCTTCKNPFVLREDGIAEKVPAPPAEPAPAARATPPAAAASAPRNGTSMLPPTAPTPAERNPTGALARNARAERLNQQQEDARKAMAANLANAASAALSAETVKREAAAEKKTERRKATDKIGKSGRTGEGRVGDIGPAVLTGTGERDHRNRLAWLLGIVGFIAVLAALIVLISRTSPQAQALTDYTAVVAPGRNHYPERARAIEERAWLLGMPPLTDAGRVTFGPVRTIPFAPVRDVLATLVGLRFAPANRLWIAPERAADADRLWDARKDRAANLALLRERQVPAIDHDAIADGLEGAGWSEDDVAMLVLLVQGRTARDGGNWIAERLAAGERPDAVEVATFAGANGTRLIDRGRDYDMRTVDHRGRLLRFIGSGWPEGWKVLELTTTLVK